MRAEPDRDLSLRPNPALWQGKPTALRIALGGRLRRLREASGITREAAGDTIRASSSKISRLELGRVASKERDVADLLTLYGVTDAEERETLLALARQANGPGWWRQYGDVLPNWFETYLGLEQAASVIRAYEPQLVPGLLQTKDSPPATLGRAARTLLSSSTAPLGTCRPEDNPNRPYPYTNELSIWTSSC